MAEQASKNEILSEIKPLNVNYDFKAPVMSNYEDVYAQMKAVSDKYKDMIISDENEANEIGKRGGLITQMRKVSKGINEIKVDVHRKAKEAYADFDTNMDKLNDLITNNIDNLSSQVEVFNQKQQERRRDEINKMFDEEKNSYQFEKIDKNLANFDNFYDKSLLKKSMTDNKIKELIVQYLVKKSQDSDIMRKFLEENKEIIKVDALKSFFVNLYFETEDINAAIVQTLDKKKQYDKAIEERMAAEKAELERKHQLELEEERRKREIAEKQAQQATPTQPEPTSTKETPKEDNDVKVEFVIAGLEQANKVKTFMEENGISFESRIF